MDFHYMNSDQIITNVRHFNGRGYAVDDFFIVFVNHWEAAQFLGRLYVDEDSMMRLLEWASDHEGEAYRCLISIDGKYGAIATLDEIEKPQSGSRIVKLHDVFLAPISHIKSEFRKLLAINPKIGNHLNVQAFQRAVPDRIVFRPGADFGPGSVTEGVQSAIRNIEGATDDALVWIEMLGEVPQLGLDQKLLEEAKRELRMRIEKGSEFRSTFFPLNEVSLREIEARGRRARRDMERYRLKFPNEKDMQFEYEELQARNAEIERYCRRLSNDRLVELCVFLFNKEEWHGDSFKLVGMEFYRRVGIAGE
jgi:hypothetical protein